MTAHQQRELDTALTAMTARAEAAEARATAWRNRCNSMDAEYSDLVRSRDTATAIAEQMRQRAEAAEAKLTVLLGADKPNKLATPTQIMRHWMLVASEQERRAEAAEHQLAAVPWTALFYCWGHKGDWEEDEWVNHSDTINNWLRAHTTDQEVQP